MNYKDLQVWKLTDELIIEIHRMTLTDLPSYERHETGRQIRRSVKSVQSNIVEGFGRKYYQAEYVRFLVMALASLDETRNHLEILFKTGSLTDAEKYNSLLIRINDTGRKLNKLIQRIRMDLK